MATSDKAPVHGLTNLKLSFLPHVAHLQICTVAHLCGFTGRFEKNVRDHTLDLVRHGLLDTAKMPVMSGTSPLIYRLSKEGAKHLGLPLFPYPSQLMMQHELDLRSFRVWLEKVRRAYGHEPLKFWHMGSAAYVGSVQPDALFVYPFKDGKKLTGMVEIDRGTENLKRWEDKFSRYSAMMQAGELKKVIGEDRGRILVVTPDEARRDAITMLLARMLQNARIERERFWVTERSTLGIADLKSAVWRVPESGELRPLVPEGVL